MSVDLAALHGWVGHSQTDDDTAALRPARLLAATLGLDGAALQAGAALPPLWHWLYFLEGLPPDQLGRDGHPALGGFLPPVPLPNRMWAGGRLRWLAPLPLGAALTRRSQVLRIESKQGRSGPLVFVTVRHDIAADGQAVIEEEQDLVYRQPVPAAALAPAPEAADGVLLETLRTDATLLFRYSALTFNGHRIHYDVDYCRDVEGYAGLVVHGPLQATWLAGVAQRHLGRPLTRLTYRALAPATAGMTLSARLGREADDGLTLASVMPDGAVSMQAKAEA
ncbi:MAG: MaoC family dehydratase N-terminal domain-containing protein [Proteobacteria bacterium]|nr:MaoC family dehydratase N-terminal domain-containing protein [Pseudomonadota bacterium]